MLHTRCFGIASGINSRLFIHFKVTAKKSPAAQLRSYTRGAKKIKQIESLSQAASLDSPRPRTSGLGSISLFVAVSGLFWLGWRVTLEPGNGYQDESLKTAKMAVQIPPGRPGNLTESQEAKLKEFWATTLKVFGVYEAEDHSSTNGAVQDLHSSPKSTAPTDQHRIEADNTEKKKKRTSFFGRKHQEKEDDLASSSHSAAESHDADDKYGQTKEYHNALASQSPEELRTSFWGMVKHDHPDALLLRFLRARKWDVQKALVMLISTMHWRAKEMHVDDVIVKEGEEWAAKAAAADDKAEKKRGDDFLAQMRLGKSFLHGIDAEGRPICCVRVRLHRQGEQSEESLERYTVFVIETARLLLSSSIDTAAILFDMTGFSMANMDYTPVKFMIKCFEANYPESLGAVLVYKSPWIFQGIWAIIKGWLDPVVASKVHFVKNIDELERYVPRNHVLKEMDGTEDWSYHYPEPVSGENAAMLDTGAREELLAARKGHVSDFEKATINWMSTTTDSGTVRQERDKLADSLRTNYWRLDPYIRGRTSYDRLGVIKTGGIIDNYPAKEQHKKDSDSVD